MSSDTFNSKEQNPAFDRLSKRHSLFWEVAPHRIPAILMDSDEWVIPRIFEYGQIEDIKDVIALYGKERSIEVLREATLRPMARAMAFVALNLNKDNEFTV